MGWLCDRIGPRKTHTWLLILGSLPVMGIGLAHDYTSFLIFRLAIGMIGSSFVVTQYHTSVMFAPNVVGTANAAAAGWGNLGGGVTQMAMPLLFTAFRQPGRGRLVGLAHGDVRSRRRDVALRHRLLTSLPRTRPTATSPSCGLDGELTRASRRRTGFWAKLRAIRACGRCS